MTRKLTPAMLTVLRDMLDGWELGHNTTLRGRCWMQKGGIGCGGPSKDVKTTTVHGLYQRGLIEPIGPRFPNQSYRIVPSWHDEVCVMLKERYT